MSSFAKNLEIAWEKRVALRGRTNAFRLLNGAASGTPGIIVDLFGDYLVVYAYEKDLRAIYGDFSALLMKITGAKGVALKDRSAKGEDGRDEGREMAGLIPETVDVKEGALKFRVHLQHPRNVGLFLDTRLLREILIHDCRDHEVLNLFSYSCSLGTAAAFGNLGSVVNVDLSARYLGWGKENLALNGLPSEKTKFVRMDSEKYLDWAAKKAQAYDVVILDPPSFSRSPSGTFSFAQDYWRLLEKCARLLRPSGKLYALTNFGGITPPQFRQRIEESVSAVGRRIAAMRRLPLPEDFDGAGDSVSGKHLSEHDLPGSPPSVEGTLLAFESVLD